MNFSANTHHIPQTICVKITTKSPQKICLQVFDYDNRKTAFTDRWMVINGTQVLEVMMPMTPKKALISVFNFANGNIKKDNSFTVTEADIYRKKLKTRYDVIPVSNTKVNSFIKFSQNFAYHASYLIPELYSSDDKLFFINYLEKITDPNGNELTTPARVNKETGEIQVSKKMFFPLTIPERMAILLHEFSHFNLNENIDNESEADLNGLLIYLGLGFPRIEASNAWIDVFANAQTNENKARYELIEKFISDFENNKI